MSIDHNVSDFCLATIVTPKSIEAMLEADGAGLFKDQHLWRVAETFFQQARAADLAVPLLFAVRDGEECWFSHWSMIDSIEVLELPDSRGKAAAILIACNPSTRSGKPSTACRISPVTNS